MTEMTTKVKAVSVTTRFTNGWFAARATEKSNAAHSSSRLLASAKKDSVPLPVRAETRRP